MWKRQHEATKFMPSADGHESGEHHDHYITGYNVTPLIYHNTEHIHVSYDSIGLSLSFTPSVGIQPWKRTTVWVSQVACTSDCAFMQVDRRSAWMACTVRHAERALGPDKIASSAVPHRTSMAPPAVHQVKLNDWCHKAHKQWRLSPIPVSVKQMQTRYFWFSGFA